LPPSGRRQREAKNGEFEAESRAIFAVEIAGDIPPFIAEIGVRPVIGWKHELPVFGRPGVALKPLVTQQFRQT